MAGEVTNACISSVYLINTTYICVMAAMVESPICKNGVIGDVFCKACTSCFAASMALSVDDGKCMVK